MKLVRSNEISILRRTQCCLSVCCTFQYNFHTNAVELEIELDFSQLAKQTISRNVAIEWFPENISVDGKPTFPCSYGYMHGYSFGNVVCFFIQ